MKRSTKRVLISIGGVLVIVAVLGGIKAAQIATMVKAGKSFHPPPETVTTATVAADEWQLTTSAVGSVASREGVLVAAELPGTVQKINFESGETAKKGDVLVQLDASIEQAQLTAVIADHQLADTNLERTRVLEEKGAVAKAELDQAQAQFDRTGAQVASLRATIAKKAIRAPFAGQLGIRQVNLGQVVSSGAPIVSLESLDQLFVDFTLPQRALGSIAVDQDIEARVDAFPDETWRGKISAIDPRVDVATRSAKIRALVSNDSHRLRPGMSASVDVIEPRSEKVIVIPATAVLFAPYGDSVFLVDQRSDPAGQRILLAKQQFVRLGARRGDFVAVVEGLKPGQIVVTSGVFKLRNEMPLVINNQLAPPASLNPRPNET